MTASSTSPAANIAVESFPPASSITESTPRSLASSRSVSSSPPLRISVLFFHSSVKSGASSGMDSGLSVSTTRQGWSRPSSSSGTRIVRDGLSRRTVSPLVRIASTSARSRCTSARDSAPLNHCPSPSGLVIRPSSDIAHFQITHGIPVRCTFAKGRRISPHSFSKTRARTVIPAFFKMSSAAPACDGFGSAQP